MAQILSFPQPGDCCANCNHYLQTNYHGYCSNPEIKDNYIAKHAVIGEFDLSRKPEYWCTKYKRAEWLNNAQNQ